MADKKAEIARDKVAAEVDRVAAGGHKGRDRGGDSCGGQDCSRNSNQEVSKFWQPLGGEILAYTEVEPGIVVTEWNQKLSLLVETASDLVS